MDPHEPDHELSRDQLLQKLAEERQLNQELRLELTHREVAADWRASQIQQLTRRLTEAEERERKRISQALHDDLQQLLMAIKFHIQSLQQTYQGQWAAQPSLERIGALIDDTIEKFRHLVREIHPPDLSHFSLAESLEHLGTRLQADYGLQVSIRKEKTWREPKELPMRAFLYRCVQELLLNAAKHAQTRRARVRLSGEGRLLKMVVTDAGIGFNPQRLPLPRDAGTGLGLPTIRERVHSLGGSVRIHSSPTRGTQIVLQFPDTDGRAP